ncbi:hypothetical protein MMC31_007665 [Peltigera leucophlebia]|nr:hypothetical protein [Peltigera leucophlebia]
MLFKSSLPILLLLSPVAFARPMAQEVVYVTITLPAEGQSAPTPTPPPPAPAAKAAATTTDTTTQPTIQPTTQPQPQANYAAASGSKRGLAYNNESPSLQPWVSHPKISWGHCWASVDFSLPQSLEFVPTLADLTPDSLPYWDANVKKALARQTGETKYLQFLNEPDQPGQKALTDPASAAAAFKQYMNKYAAPNVKLGSPSVTNGVVNGMGLEYLKKFLAACQGCTIDFIPVHWYGCGDGCAVAQDVALFKEQIQDAINLASGKPVWIPEFQHLGSLESQKTFLESVLPWLDNKPEIERYAYFMVKNGFLLTDNQLNEVASAYVS